MRNRKPLFITAIAAVAAIACATVSYDPVAGGWVGKGDVQIAFGWNNKTAQTEAKNVTFTFNSTTSTEIVCEWWTGPERNRSLHQVDHTISSGVNATIAYDARKTGQYTGYFLSPAGNSTETGDPIPALGDPCPGNNGNGSVVVEVSDTVANGDGGLSVSWNGNTVPLPNTPIVP